jgi:chemotaxis protein CheC
MNLTAEQHDAITELINIAFARTAKSLSDITGFHVMLDVPAMKLDPLGDLIPQLASQMANQDVATIQQTFTGQLSGTAMLLLDYNTAVSITDLVTVGYTPYRHHLDHASGEVLTEVGNILLNACLSSLGNLLKLHLCFSMPRLQLRSVESIPDALALNAMGHQYTLSVCTQFRLQNVSINGYLVLVLEETALAQLLSAIDRWVDQPIHLPIRLPSVAGQK